MATSTISKVDVLSVISSAGATPEVASEVIAHDRWASRYPDDAWKRIKLEGVFLACIPLLGALVIAILLLGEFAAHPTVRAILICGLGGITGSWMYSVRVYVHSVMRGHWRTDYVVERLTTPFTGVFLAVSAYTLIETGMLGITFNIKQDSDRAFYMYAVGFFVGLFSEDVMGKLTGIAKNFFGKPADHGIRKNGKRG